MQQGPGDKIMYKYENCTEVAIVHYAVLLHCKSQASIS